MSSQVKVALDSRLRSEAPVEEASPVWSEEQARAEWAALVSRLRRRDEEAAREFLDCYGAGTKLLFQRRLGGVSGARLAVEAVQGAIEEVRLGSINTPRDLVHFLRKVLDRMVSKAGATPLAGASDRARISEKAKRLEKALRKLTSLERSALMQHYQVEAPQEQADGPFRSMAAKAGGG